MAPPLGELARRQVCLRGERQLVGDLHHGKAHDLVADLEALLEYLCDGVFRHTFLIGVHHRVVQIGIEGVALLTEDLHTHAIQDLHKLRHGH